MFPRAKLHRGDRSIDRRGVLARESPHGPTRT
jgi:hypothetical protein